MLREEFQTGLSQVLKTFPSEQLCVRSSLAFIRPEHRLSRFFSAWAKCTYGAANLWHMLSGIAIGTSRTIHFHIINIKIELQWHAFGLSSQWRRFAHVRWYVAYKYIRDRGQVDDPHLNEICWSPTLPIPDACWATSFSHGVHYTWAIVDILEKERKL